MATGDAEEELPDCLRELVELPEEQERALLEHILTEGWDQGCLLELDGKELPPLSPDQIADPMQILAERHRQHPELTSEDPFDSTPLPQRLPEEPGDSALVVLSQRCDLIKGIGVEPLVEVAVAHVSGDRDLVGAVRGGSSSNFAHLADVDTGQAWMVDLRTRGYLPKHWLGGREPHHLLEEGRPRKRFAMAVGARHSRDPVPASLIAGFQAPLRDWLYSGAQRNQLASHFSQMILLQEGDEWVLLAVIGEGKDRAAAEEAFDALLAMIAEKVSGFPLNTELSEALPLDEISAADYLTGHRLDFARVTYGSRSERRSHAEPPA